MADALTPRLGAKRLAALILAVACVLLAAAGAVEAASSHFTAKFSGTKLTLLKADVLPSLGKLRNLGPLQGSRRIDVAITVKQNLGALYKAEWAMYTPGSATYRDFLTPAQYQRKYGAPLAQVEAIRAFGTARGLTLVNPGTLYDYVELSGTVAQVEATFGVELDNFKDATGKAFFANLQPPTVPSTLGIDAVLGLETFDRYHVDGLDGSGGRSANVVTRLAKRAKSTRLTAGQRKQILASAFRSPQSPATATTGRAAKAGQGSCETDPTNTLGTICTGLLSPQALWDAYDLPTGNPAKDDYGQGQTIGIIGEGQTADVIAALREFENTRGLPFVPVQVYHTDPGESAAESTLDDSGRIEWEMDSQSSTGMAPEVSQLRMYFGSSLALTELTGAIGTWVNDPNGPLQVSASLGACEDTPAEDVLLGAAQRTDQAFLIQAAMEGRTLFSSAGDTGTGCEPVGEAAVNGVTYGGYPGQEYPAIDPNTTAVGGSVLYTNGSGARELEQAWDHTGGGPSKFLPQPPYQAEADSPYLKTNTCPGVYGDGTTSWDPSWPTNPPYLCRADVDVAAESGSVTIITDHKVGDFYLPGGYNPTTQPIQANGFDMVDFCPASEVSGEEPAEPDCAYDANGGRSETVQTDDGPQQGVMTDNFAEGGTSLSSPLWLGMWARIQAHRDAGNSPRHSLGLANEVIYKLGSDAATDARDFYDIETGANPLPAGPGWDYPSGWGSPNVTALIEDASGTPHSTAPARDVMPGRTDPPALVAKVPGGPACTYAFYVGDPSAPDLVTGGDDQNLALVQGTFGLTPDGKDLRAVINLQNLSETPPQGSTMMDYEFYWTNPSGDTGPNAVDVQVDSLGNVTYQYGTETVTTTEGEADYSFSETGAATGTFGSGKDGAIEVDIPLSELGLKAGEVLTAPSAYTAEGWGLAGNNLTGEIVDQAGPGNRYTVGQPTCIDRG
jgi:hypothetical protein